MRSKLAALGISLALLAGCEWRDSPTVPVVEPESQAFTCEQIRSGATLQELVDHETARGVDKESIDANLITSVRETCPEFAILIEEYYTN